MNKKFPAPLLLLAALAVASSSARAADPPPPGDQVVVPEIDRRDIKAPKFPSNDFELGLFGGTYATQNFGASAVGGLRAGYHITEDFFVEGVYAYTKVSDEDFRQILPGGIFPKTTVNVTYYNLSLGYNVLPGEIFFGGRRAKASAAYLIAGVGSTKFDVQRRPTFNAGFGLRIFPFDWAALQVDLRDHVYSLDLLGRRQTTQNLELTGGLTFFF